MFCASYEILADDLLNDMTYIALGGTLNPLLLLLLASLHYIVLVLCINCMLTCCVMLNCIK